MERKGRTVRPNILLLAAAAALIASAPAGAAQTGCEPVEYKKADETIPQLAARCGIRIETLLHANNAKSVAELEKRRAIAVPQDRLGKDWLDRARNAVVDAGRQIDDAAKAAGRSVSDYLRDKPDLNREVLSFGEKLGLPGVKSGPAKGPRLDVKRQGKDMLAVSASGLPGDQKVIFGRIDGEKVKPLMKLRTNETGRFKTSVRLASPIAGDRRVMFVVETADRKLRLAADPFGGN